MAADAEFQVLAERMDRIGGDILEIKDEIKVIASGMEKIVRLEVRHESHGKAIERAFTAMQDFEGRLKTLEVQEPINKMVGKWVVSGVLGVVAILGVQVVSMVFITKSPPPPVVVRVDRQAPALDQQEPRR